MSITAPIDALSERYSWKNRMMLPMIAQAAMTQKLVPIAFIDVLGNIDAAGCAQRRYHGTGSGLTWMSWPVSVLNSNVCALTCETGVSNRDAAGSVAFPAGPSAFTRKTCGFSS